MPNSSPRDEPPVGQIIATTTTPAPTVNIAATARKRSDLSPTDRLEARADLHITELKADKDRLQQGLQKVRTTEIPHLREDLRWLEGREFDLASELATLKTSYEWAIAFNWFSFALVAIGGGFVSYASFLAPPQSPAEMDSRTTVATISVVALLIGVIMQAIVSYHGTRRLIQPSEVTDPAPQRPSPNPHAPRPDLDKKPHTTPT